VGDHRIYRTLPIRAGPWGGNAGVWELHERLCSHGQKKALSHSIPNSFTLKKPLLPSRGSESASCLLTSCHWTSANLCHESVRNSVEPNALYVQEPTTGTLGRAGGIPTTGKQSSRESSRWNGDIMPAEPRLADRTAPWAVPCPLRLFKFRGGCSLTRRDSDLTFCGDRKLFVVFPADLA